MNKHQEIRDRFFRKLYKCRYSRLDAVLAYQIGGEFYCRFHDQLYGQLYSQLYSQLKEDLSPG